MNLTIRNLSKTYSNGVKALNDVSLDIPTGMFGLLGPNGAGKSSLMRTIATLQEPDTGSIMLGDLDVLREKDEVRKILGYLPQEFGVYPKVSAEVLLDHLAVLKGVANNKERKVLVESLLHKTNLWQSRKKYLGGYSGGMKQRFGIAQALLSNPKLIIVDEPTAGLDPAERNRFLNLLSELGENTVVILSTHIVDDVKELCTSMAIINLGTVLYQGSPAKALEEVAGKVWKKKIEKAELEQYQNNFTVISDRLIAGKPEIHVLSDTKPDGSFESVEADLEDVYFSHILSSTQHEAVPA
ncbi:ABC transporter ATP-binding protein [Ekhidna sp.]|jgi:ABC-2 type transport system ATP-binding protein|uniref:ABC transporter ATP-binding protein n=1 Tax=Ekhidna sp. TaxID=2608089 RepID=UPI0032ED1614